MSPSLGDSNGVGTVSDVSMRLRATLPTGWFPTSPPAPTPSSTPVLDGLLTGLSSAWSFCFSLLSITLQQTRIGTATSSFLDLISADFFGTALPRIDGESDDSFRARISASLVSRRGTRDDVIAAVESATSLLPIMVEPHRPADCGGYGGTTQPSVGGALGYGVVGLCYGSNGLPFQFLLNIPAYAAFAPGVFSARQSSATFIDTNGAMQLVGPFVLRPDYAGSEYQGPLVEPRGFNLLTDSRSWKGFAQVDTGNPAAATWMIIESGSALFQSDSVLSVNSPAGTRVAGPSIDIATAGSTVTASTWVFVPAASNSTLLELMLSDLSQPASVTYVAADMTQTGQWQRLVGSLQTQAAPGRNLRIGLVLSGVAGTIAGILTQCWQVEPGAAATSYIPSNGSLGIRAQDDVLNKVAASPPLSVAISDVLDAVVSTIPAATIAWTSMAMAPATG